MELVQSGRPIPEIKEIPNTVLVDHGTKPIPDPRRKPWERNRSEQQTSDRLSTAAEQPQQ